MALLWCPLCVHFFFSFWAHFLQRLPPAGPIKAIVKKAYMKGLSGDFYKISPITVTCPGELKQLLMTLSRTLDNDTKRATLHSITRCVQLKETEANSCTTDDISSVASFLDDGDEDTKLEVLNALKAFTVVWRFKIKIQEYVPKIIQITTANWGNDLKIAGLILLNALQIPDYAHSVLITHLPRFMDILLVANTETKVQVLKFLNKLAENRDLLYGIMNCQAPPEFLNLFQPSQPGNLLYEILVFVEHLSDGKLSSKYQSSQWQYNENSLHETLFGENSRLSERLLALIIHPEEEVQTQACKVILSLRLSKEEGKSSNGLSMESDSFNANPLESSRISELANGSLQPLLSSTLTTITEHSSESAGDESGHSFHPLQVSNTTNLSVGGSMSDHSFIPFQEVGDQSTFKEPSFVFTEPSSEFAGDKSGHSFHHLQVSNTTNLSVGGAESDHSSFIPHQEVGDQSTFTEPSSVTAEPSSESAGGESGHSFHPLQVSNATNLSVGRAESDQSSFIPHQEDSDQSSVPDLEESSPSFQPPPVADSDDSDTF